MEDIEAFLAIVEEGGQTAAARRLGRSLQATNRALASLERSVGVELIRRTTRRSFPTEAGWAFYHKVKPAMAAITEARAEAGQRRAEPRGVLKIGAPTHFSAAFLMPAIADFMRRHPDVAFELRASDAPVDVIGEALDLAIRIRHLPDSSLKARKLGELRIVTYGAPAYFARRGRPIRPEQLADHLCILHADAGESRTSWPFRIDGDVRQVDVAGPLRTNDIAAAHAAALNGLGVSRGPHWQIRAWLERGELATVLEAFEAPPLPVYAVFPASPGLPAKTRLFLDHLAERLGREPP